eukprot:scpid12213/ scgid7413/ 
MNELHDATHAHRHTYALARDHARTTVSEQPSAHWAERSWQRPTATSEVKSAGHARLVWYYGACVFTKRTPSKRHRLGLKLKRLKSAEMTHGTGIGMHTVHHTLLDLMICLINSETGQLNNHVLLFRVKWPVSGL